MSFKRNQDIVNDYYKKELKEKTNLYGSELSQTERFRNALGYFNTFNREVFELGSGKGDFLSYLFSKPKYLPYYFFGLDIMPEMTKIAKKNWPGGNACFKTGDFLGMSIDPFDLGFAFSVFDRKFGSQEDTKEYAFRCLEKMYELCNEGVYMTFLSAYKKINDIGEALFYPDEVLKECHRYSERVVIDHSFMPHAFAVILYKKKSVWLLDYEKSINKL